MGGCKGLRRVESGREDGWLGGSESGQVGGWTGGSRWLTAWNDGHAFALRASLSNAKANERTWMW